MRVVERLSDRLGILTHQKRRPSLKSTQRGLKQPPFYILTHNEECYSWFGPKQTSTSDFGVLLGSQTGFSPSRFLLHFFYLLYHLPRSSLFLVWEGLHRFFLHRLKFYVVSSINEKKIYFFQFNYSSLVSTNKILFFLDELLEI